jgi:peptidoglycan/xylan/chitin deacetylase (PgdA/CDA1 family)
LVISRFSTGLVQFSRELRASFYPSVGKTPPDKKQQMTSRLFIFLLVMANLQPSGVRAQTVAAADPQTKEIAITIDDVPLNGKQFELARLQTMTDKLLTAIKRDKVPVVGFVNESLLYITGETDGRIALLRQWSNAGVELGNHTFAHVGFKETPIASYEDDFRARRNSHAGNTREKGTKPRYFRHPFLQMGTTLEQERAFENFIGERGYRTAPITIDILDWMFRCLHMPTPSLNKIPR